MKSLLTLIFSVVLLNASAQQITIKGKIADAGNASLPGAAVSLLSKSDSSVITSAATDMDGAFQIMTSFTGDKMIRITFLGFVDKFVNVSSGQTLVELGTITLQEKPTQLNEVDVNETKIPVQTKGDTIQYNADAFKVNRDATAEDLATKMPGISTQDGKIQAQGEEVKKVLIDGKAYLGDDANAAMKNLPAEVIDKIQVFDKKSDQAEFTGFDDGNTQKTINIVTRPEFRNGTFGKAFAGMGTDELWKSGANINSFKDKRKLSFLLNANNINDQNFSTDDLLGVIGTNARSDRPRGTMVQRGGGGGGGGGGRWGQNDASNFLVDQKNGIITTYAGGLNYVNTWGDLELSGSYFYNQTQNNARTDLTRQYFTGEDFGLIYTENNTGRVDNYNHRGNFKIDYKFDSLNSITVQPKFSFQKNKSVTAVNGQNASPEGPVSDLLSGTLSNMNGYNISSPILYRHKFLKKGRTVSLNVTPAMTSSEGTASLNSLTSYSDTTSTDTLDQVSDNQSGTKSVISELIYTEPVGQNGQLSLNYRNNYSYSSADKLTYSFEQLDTSLSNKFESRYLTNTPSANYRYQKEKWNVSAGLGYQISNLKNDQVFPYEAAIDKQFKSFLPSMMFQYKFTPKKNLRVFYRSFNNAPSVRQLQNVVDNSNPLQLSTGNPFLEQDWQNFFNIRYSATNSEKNTSFFTYYNFTYTEDYIGSSSIIAENDTTVNTVFVSEGNQLTFPVNLSGSYSTRAFMNYSFPLKFMKSSLGLNGGGSYSRTPGMINGQKNYSRYATGNFGFSLSSNISEKFDFNLSSSLSYNNIRNTLETNSNSEYYNLNTKFRIQVMPYKGIVIQTDIAHQTNDGLSASYNQDYYLWNAGIGYKFLDKQQAEIRLTVFDILEQNKNISRNTTDLYYEDIQTNVLSQYFMVTFTYNLKRFVPAK